MWVSTKLMALSMSLIGIVVKLSLGAVSHVSPRLSAYWMVQAHLDDG